MLGIAFCVIFFAGETAPRTRAIVAMSLDAGGIAQSRKMYKDLLCSRINRLHNHRSFGINTMARRCGNSSYWLFCPAALMDALRTFFRSFSFK